jgi:hypothetical protein
MLKHSVALAALAAALLPMRALQAEDRVTAGEPSLEPPT